jgi:alpha-beta hydrolase superfamily lysophospholipase
LASIPASRHEVLMETDAVRAAFWQAFDRLAKGLCV